MTQDDIELSELAIKIKGSPTYALTSKTDELRRQGHDVIALNVGEPDFDTPIHIKEAAYQALLHEKSSTRYTPPGGILSVKQSICRKLERENNISVVPDQVIVTSGAKQAIYNCLSVLTSSGDEVILLAPYWVSYSENVIITGAKPVVVLCSQEDRFKVTPEKLRQAITPKTKAILLNSPSNPSGVVYTKEELLALLEVIREHPKITLISDEIYEHIILNDEDRHWSPLALKPEMINQIVVINGVSKAYAMTGWRIGFAAGPQKIIKAMKSLQSQQTGCTTAVSQFASKAAWDGPQDCVKIMCESYKKRHDLLISLIQEHLPLLKCSRAQGAFYLFVDASKAIQQLHTDGKITEATDTALCMYLLTIANVAILPGVFSGFPNFIRISFAASEENIIKAVERIKKALHSS